MLRRKTAGGIRDIALSNTFRELWEQHIMWSRAFIVSKVDGLEDLDAVTKRLLQNPGDFARVLERYYGRRRADEFQALLEEHLLIAADVVEGAMEKNEQKTQEAKKRWYRNADEIAAFLSGINPNWSKSEWERLLHEHLQMLETYTSERIAGQYEKDVATYDAMETEALKMADYMTLGIERQFGRGR